MTIPDWAWERRLSALAHEPLQHDEAYETIHVDEHVLERAHAHCARLTQDHSKTFYTASALLPPAKRRAVRALYAFCRGSDDLVDRQPDDPLAQLDAWRERTLLVPPSDTDLVAVAWADARLRYRIPARYAHQLIDGVARDVQVKRYQTF